jgi:hypothetical protein
MLERQAQFAETNAELEGHGSHSRRHKHQSPIEDHGHSRRHKHQSPIEDHGHSRRHKHQSTIEEIENPYKFSTILDDVPR